MAQKPFNKFDVFVLDLGRKVHDLSLDALNVVLTDTPPTAADLTDADLVEIAPGNGYSAGGSAVGGTAWAGAAGVATLTGGSVAFTAAVGAIGPARCAVLVNAAYALGSRPLIGWWDYGSSVNIPAGQSLTVDLGAGILDIA